MPNIHNPLITLLSTNTVLSSSQIQNLHTTPVTIIPAPGAGLVIIPFELVLVLAVGSQPFQTSGSDTTTTAYSPTNSAAFGSYLTTITRTTNTITGKVATQPTNAPFTPAANPIDNNSITFSSAANYNVGAITAATIAVPGTGYAVNDTGTINGGGGNATYIITSIGAAGAVTAFTVTAGGSGYSTSTNTATTNGGAQPGVGAGFQVNVTAIQAGNGTIRLVAYYTIIPAP